jgi:hypothetical protein
MQGGAKESDSSTAVQQYRKLSDRGAVRASCIHKPMAAPGNVCPNGDASLQQLLAGGICAAQCQLQPIVIHVDDTLKP